MKKVRTAPTPVVVNYLEELEGLFKAPDSYVVLFFHADWCYISQLLKQKVFQEFVNKQSFSLATIDVDEADPALSNKFNAAVIPYALLYQGSFDNLTYDFVGMDEMQLSNMMSETTRHF